MGITVEAVDPRRHAADAAGVLQSAWGLPRLRYAPEELAWQFARPGWGDPLGWLARDEGGAAVAFAAALPRVVRHGGRPREVWLASFYAALPGSPAAPLALLRAEVRALKATGRPSFVFAAPGSTGELLLKANDAAGYRRNALGVGRVFGGVAPVGPVGAEAREAGPADADALAVLADCDQFAGAVTDAVGPELVAYDATDPRGRCWAVVPGPGGGVLAGACTHVTDSIAVDGPTRLATLSSVVVPPDDGGAALAALVGFAARRWAGRVTSPIVTLPNPTGIPPGHLRAARLRATPAAWAPYLFCQDPADPLLSSTHTTLEVI